MNRVRALAEMVARYVTELRRPPCYKKHNFEIYYAVLNNCSQCPHEKSCWGED